MKILNSAKSLVSNPGCAHWHSLASGAASQVVDPERLGVLARLELYPDKDGPDFRFLGHELCLGSPRPKPITA
jgi:hypothetical protein